MTSEVDGMCQAGASPSTFAEETASQIVRVERKPFKLREMVFRSDRYKAGCLCPGTEDFQKKPCRRCAGPFVVTMVKEVWPNSQTGWIVNVKHKRTGAKFVGWDSSWFIRRTQEKKETE